jgi:hypothetical protein
MNQDFPKNLRKKIIKEAEFNQYIDPMVGLVASIDYLGYNVKMSFSNICQNPEDISDMIVRSLVDRLLVSTDVINSLVKIETRDKNLKILLK